MNHSSSESGALALAPDNGALQVIGPQNAASLILGPSFDRVQAFAGLMCKGAVTVPQHLRGNPGDCMAVTIAALSRNMDPFAFAQKTHITKSGALGYESQLIAAMITASGQVVGKPEFEFLGDWNKILGKVKEQTSDKGGKYYVATYSKEDEQGLGVIIRQRLAGEREPRELQVLMSQCYPRFSTQWATDPQQQICYVAGRKFARRYAPEVLLGVYDVDEMETGEPKFMGPADVVDPPPEPQPTSWPADLFAKRLPEWRKAIAEGRATVDGVITKAKTKHPLTDAQVAAIRAPAAAATPAPAPDQQAGAPAMTEADVQRQMDEAKDQDALNEAAALIDAIPDAGARERLNTHFDVRNAELS